MSSNFARQFYSLLASVIFWFLAALIGVAQNPADEQLPPMPTTPHPAPEPIIVKGGHHAGPQVTGNTEQSYDCPFCSLHGFDFSGRDLTDANLEGADLSSANFTGAILNGVAMTRANLQGANFTNAKLDTTADGPADLSLSDLRGAVFTGAQTNGTDFEFAEMSGADFSKTDLSKARIGPTIKAGVENGRKTSFRDARVAQFQVDAEKVDVTGTHWLKATHAKQLAASAEWSCDNADLSKLASVVYVNPTGTDGPSCGSTAAGACKTIQQGISRCLGTACGVLAYWAEYPLTDSIQMANGVSLYGGCLASTPTNGYASAIIAPASGAPAITASNISSPTTLQGFKLIGASLTSVNGAPTSTLLAASSNGLTLANIEFVAGKGADGAVGGNGNPGTAGGNANGQTGGTVGACSSTSGGNGAGQMAVDVPSNFWVQCNAKCGSDNCWGQYGMPGTTGQWVSGGSPGSGNCTCCPISRGTNGNTGNPGQNGSCGGKGAVSTKIAGTFSGTTWSGNSGGAGGNGGNASGGGGGGSGGYRAGTCFWVRTTDPGNSGGGGGAGGCGATPGSPGQQGGASFGVIVVSSNLTINSSRVVGGRSGNGGKGGSGQQGGKNGTAAGGATNTPGGYGGPGGAGGAGGASGGAAGGNSGPAIGVALVSGSTLNAPGLVYYLGHDGAPGLPGSGGTPIIAGACTAPNGDNGVAGLVANTNPY